MLKRFLSDPDQNLMAQARAMDELVAASDYETSRDGDVLRLYRAFFDREPDIDGALYWLGVRKDYGLTQIAVFFTASQEYINSYAGTTDREFLRRVYRNVLGRSFDQAGFDYWLGVLGAGTSRGEVVRWVAASEEFKAVYPYKL